ncbi:MAG TPA: TlpA disulfide reductase family protein [Candidatus Binatia bacterium]|jgi:peroxiredoxin
MVEGHTIISFRFRLILWTLVLAALLLVYYFHPRFRPPTPMTGGSNRSGTLALEKPKKDIAAPDFTLADPAGRRVSLKDFHGKVVFLNFWATWCGPCRDEMPMMEALHREFKDQGLAVIAVNFEEDKQSVRSFFDELGLTFHALLDPDGKVSERYNAISLPLTYIIDRNGRFVAMAIGIRPWDGAEAKALIRDLLDRKAAPQAKSAAVDLADPRG